jgi:hypothetical protein
MIAILFRLFTASLCLLTLVNTPQFGQQVQISEGLFVLLCLSVLPAFLKRFKELWSFDTIDTGVSIFLLGAVIANFRQGNYLGIAAILYLVGIYFVSSRMLRLQIIDAGTVHSAIRDLGILSTIFALAGPFVSYLDLRELKYLPFIGEVWRSKGFLPSPSFQGDVLFLILLVRLRGLKSNLLYLLFAGIAILLTLPKVLFLILAIFILGITGILNFLSYTRVMVLVVTVYLFLIHFIPLPAQLSKQPEYVGKQVLFKNDYFQIAGTQYWELKKRLIQVFPKSMPLGLGDDGFIQWQEKKWPREGVFLDPHCTYLGVFVEWGLIGALGFFIFLVASYTKVPLDRGAENTISDNLLLGLTLYLTLSMVEMFSMDMLHFRHWWLAVGMLSGLAYLDSRNEETIPKLG